jgi:hypothetical protein
MPVITIIDLFCAPFGIALLAIIEQSEAIASIALKCQHHPSSNTGAIRSIPAMINAWTTCCCPRLPSR